MKFIIYILLFISTYTYSIDTLEIRKIINQNDSIISTFSNGDSMIFYAKKSKIILENNKGKFPLNTYRKILVEILDDFGLAYVYKGKFVKASNYFTEELSLNRKLKNKGGIASNYSDIGYTYSELGEPSLALEYYFKALEIDKNLKRYTKIAIRYNNIGNIYKDVGRTKDAISYFKKCINIYNNLSDTTEIASAYLNIAAVYKEIGNFNNAMEYYARSLKINEEVHDYRALAVNLSNIGSLYQKWGKNELAIRYYKDALKYDKKTNNTIGKAVRYNNIASIFSEQEQADSSIFYFKKSLIIFEQNNLERYAATIKSNIGNSFIKNKEYNKAINIFHKSLKIFTKFNDLNNIAKNYSKLSKVYYLKEDYAKSKFYIQKSINITDSIGNIPETIIATSLLALIYKNNGNYKDAYKSLKNYNILKDSIFSNENLKQINEFEVKYKTIKKDNKIQLLQKESKISDLKAKKQESELRTQKIITYSSIAIIILIIVFLYLLYRQMVAKKRANKELRIKNTKITQQNEEITLQRDLIGEQKQSITDSILYAKNIQQALLPSTKNLNLLFNNYFVYYKPKDIVSGDFYWIKQFTYKTKNYKVIVVSDCTGHGVPGAFMSMLGTSSLSDIFANNFETCPAVVLNKLRSKVVGSLNQTGDVNEAKDGMDMSIVIINESDKTLTFSGANQDLFIVNNQSTKIDNSRNLICVKGVCLSSIKGDRMPVGIYKQKEEKFTPHTIKYENNDRIYLMSDGYVDQFGGKKNKKFKTKNLVNLLISIQDNSMKKQKKAIDKTIKNWMTEYNSATQIDDILIIGIEL